MWLELHRRVDITALADVGGKLPADATRVVKPVYASPMRVQVRPPPQAACARLGPYASRLGLVHASCTGQHWRMQGYELPRFRRNSPTHCCTLNAGLRNLMSRKQAAPGPT